MPKRHQCATSRHSDRCRLGWSSPVYGVPIEISGTTARTAPRHCCCMRARRPLLAACPGQSAMLTAFRGSDPARLALHASQQNTVSLKELAAAGRDAVQRSARRSSATHASQSTLSTCNWCCASETSSDARPGRITSRFTAAAAYAGVGWASVPTPVANFRWRRRCRGPQVLGPNPARSPRARARVTLLAAERRSARVAGSADDGQRREAVFDTMTYGES